jgi:hypothetical protein
VLERLFTVAYGCAMRSTDNEAIAELAKDVYEWIFKNGSPPPDILLRDYARGVIETGLRRGARLDIEVQKIRPPYKSKWPSKIPTKKELEKYGKRMSMSEEEWALTNLYYSVMGSGDFARYIIGTNWGHFGWSSRRLNKPRKLSRREIYEIFLQSLTNKQKEAWELYRSFRENINYYRRLDKSRKREVSKRGHTRAKLQRAITDSEQIFRKLLGKKKLKIFEEHVIPYLKDPNPYKHGNRFDLSIAQRWIFKKVLDLGWTVERFGRFDREVDPHGRAANKPERIGKKYQWIAYHEFLARVSDNFEFSGDSGSGRIETYEGPWQISYIRDIDPSCAC